MVWGSSRWVWNKSYCHCVRLASDVVRFAPYKKKYCGYTTVKAFKWSYVWQEEQKCGKPKLRCFDKLTTSMMSKMTGVTNCSFSVTQLCISVAYRCAWAAQTRSAASWQAQQSKCCAGWEHLPTLSLLPGLCAMQAHNAAGIKHQHVKQGRGDGILDTMCLLGSLRRVRACKKHLCPYLFTVWFATLSASICISCYFRAGEDRGCSTLG